MSAVYQSRHSLVPGRKPRRVVGGAVQPRSHISHRGISSRRVIITAYVGLAILDGFLFLLIGLR